MQIEAIDRETASMFVGLDLCRRPLGPYWRAYAAYDGDRDLVGLALYDEPSPHDQQATFRDRDFWFFDLKRFLCSTCSTTRRRCCRSTRPSRRSWSTIPCRRLPTPCAVIAYVDIISHHDFANWLYVGDDNGKHRFVRFLGTLEQQATMRSKLLHEVVSPHPVIRPPIAKAWRFEEGCGACAACGTHGKWAPMLRCEIWHAIADPKDILCLRMHG